MAKRERSLSGFTLGGEVKAKKEARSAYRKATRTAKKTSRIAGVEIGGGTRTGAAFETASAEQLLAEAEALMQERERSAKAVMQNIKATKGADAHKKANILFDLAGDKAQRRKLRKQLEGKESGTALQSAADALAVSRELLEMWMSEGNTISLANDGKIMF